jgi:hypothetical protein
MSASAENTHSSPYELYADDRAVSVSIGYVLTIAIVTVLISGLIAAGSGVLETQTESTIENELDIVGQQVASDLASADRLARTSGTSEVVLRTDLPQRSAGSSYRLTVDDTEDEIRLETSSPDVTVTVPFRTRLDATGTGTGGPIRIVYDSATNELEVESA